MQKRGICVETMFAIEGMKGKFDDRTYRIISLISRCPRADYKHVQKSLLK